MKRLVSLLLALLLLTGMISATDYYVKNGGNDGASGLDDDNAWETVAKVNTGPGPGYNAGDNVYFNRDDTWRERLAPPSSGASGNQITFGAYGTGDKPLILGSEDIAGWALDGGSIWVAACTFEQDYDKNVFFVEIGGAINWGQEKADKVSCIAEYDYYNDYGASELYVFAATDPDARYSAVEAAVRRNCIEVQYKLYITIENFECKFSGQNGVLGWDVNDATGQPGMIFQDNIVHHIGRNVAGSTSGNGICISSSNNIARRNTIYQIGRRGIYAPVWNYARSGILIEDNTIFNVYYNHIDMHNNHHVTCDDVIVRYNLVYTDDDYYYPGSNSTGIYAQEEKTNFKIYYNIIFNHKNFNIAINNDVDEVEIYNNVMIGRVDQATYVMSLGGLDQDLIVRNNILMNGGERLLYLATTTGSEVVENNCYYQEGGYPATISTVHGVTYDTFGDHQVGTGFDANGTGADPAFVNAGGSYDLDTDFLIPTGSPCKDAGFNIGLALDYFGNMVWSGTAPDIGVHEFQQGDIPTVIIRDVLLIRDVFIIR